MNRTRVLIIALFALALSLFTTYSAYRFLSSRISPPRQLGQIVIAKERLPLGTRLTESHLIVKSWPAEIALEGSFERPEQLVGRGVVVPIFPNEPLLESKLAPMAAGAGLTTAIPDGMRAVAVKVNDVIGVAGFALPGTRVDVILSGSPQEGREISTSKVFLENIQVLAAGQNIEQNLNGKPEVVQVITLLVTPEDAQKLALASLDGRIQLALRNPLDLEEADPAPVNRAALYQSFRPQSAPARAPSARPAPSRAVAAPPPPSPPPAPPQPRIYAVELIQGIKREVSSFEEKAKQ